MADSESENAGGYAPQGTESQSADDIATQLSDSPDGGFAPRATESQGAEDIATQLSDLSLIHI